MDRDKQIAKRDALRRSIVACVMSGDNPFSALRDRFDQRDIHAEHMYLTYHGYVTTYLEHPSGLPRQLGPAQGRLFCSWIHSPTYVSL